MHARPLRVVLVMEDRAVLRHCSRLLTVVGYEVQGTAEPSQGIALLQAVEADILVVAAGSSMEGALELLRQAREIDLPGYLYEIVVVPEDAATDVTPALEAGADDLLALPIENGELLARLRTAARVIEFERRAARQTRSRMLDQREFLSHLQTTLKTCRTPRKPLSCVVLAPDHWDQLRSYHGRRVAAELQAQFVQCLGEASSPHVLGQFEDGSYAVLIAGGADSVALWAERLQNDIGERELSGISQLSDLSLSIGATSFSGETVTAAAFLEQATQALKLAQQSGGNCLCWHEEVQAEIERWAELGGAGKLFESTTVRSIMVPCTLLVHTGESVQETQVSFQQTAQRALPVVDDEGKLAGLVMASHAQRAEDGNQPVSAIMQRDITSFDEQTTLSAIIDYFAQEAPLVIVIVNKGRPTGLVTPGSMATLIQKLTTGSFAETGDAVGASGLRVLNLCGSDGGDLVAV